MAKRLKLTKEVQETIVAAVGMGMGIPKAAAAANVSPRSVFTWLKNGEEGRSKVYIDFYKSVRNAEASFQAACLKTIYETGVEERTWQACAWLLERKFPAEFGKQVKQIVDADNSGIKDLARVIQDSAEVIYKDD